MPVPAFLLTVTVDYTEKMKQEDIGLIAGGNEIGTIYSNAIINIKNKTFFHILPNIFFSFT